MEIHEQYGLMASLEYELNFEAYFSFILFTVIEKVSTSGNVGGRVE